MKLFLIIAGIILTASILIVAGRFGMKKNKNNDEVPDDRYPLW